MPEQRKDETKKPISTFDAPYTAKYDDLVDRILKGQVGGETSNPLGEVLRSKKTILEREIEKAEAQAILDAFRADTLRQFGETSLELTQYLNNLLVLYDEIEERYVIDSTDPFTQNQAFDFNNLNGHSIRLTIPSILRCETVWLPRSHIAEMREVPDSCTTLHAPSNLLEELPPLPNSLTVLDCYDNVLESLPDSLPQSLVQINCSQNKISSLPKLPKALKILGCDANPLVRLPDLPDGLTSLAFGSGELELLPKAPDSLLNYSIEYASQITVIPSLSPRLEAFRCDNTPIKELPPLPDTINDLYIWFTGISELPAKLPAGLIAMTVAGHDRLQSLPELPEGLKILSCTHNAIDRLPKLPSTLETLTCFRNYITELPELPDGLKTIYCQECLIVDLPEIPASVVYADFSDNPLSERAKAVCRQRGFIY